MVSSAKEEVRLVWLEAPSSIYSRSFPDHRLSYTIFFKVFFFLCELILPEGRLVETSK